jgi:hypothetical protein
MKNFSFRKRVFGTNTYQLLKMHFSYFDNKTTIDLPATVPIISSCLKANRLSIIMEIFFGSIMAKTVLFSGLQIPMALRR